MDKRKSEVFFSLCYTTKTSPTDLHGLKAYMQTDIGLEGSQIHEIMVNEDLPELEGFLSSQAQPNPELVAVLNKRGQVVAWGLEKFKTRIENKELDRNGDFADFGQSLNLQSFLTRSGEVTKDAEPVSESSWVWSIKNTLGQLIFGPPIDLGTLGITRQDEFIDFETSVTNYVAKKRIFRFYTDITKPAFLRIRGEEDVECILYDNLTVKSTSKTSMIFEYKNANRDYDRIEAPFTTCQEMLNFLTSKGVQITQVQS